MCNNPDEIPVVCCEHVVPSGSTLLGKHSYAMWVISQIACRKVRLDFCKECFINLCRASQTERWPGM